MKILRAALLSTTLLAFPHGAQAGGVVVFVQAFAAGFTGGAAVGVAGTLGAFFGQTVFGSLLLNVGLNLGIAALTRQNLNTSTPDLEAVRINSRLPNADRYQLGGTVAAGGAAGLFGEFDEDGAFWYIIAHGDAELAGDPSYLLDGIAVTLSDGTDGFTAGDVLTDDFCLDDQGNAYESGTRVPYVRIYTVSPTSAQAYGTKPSAFTTAFANLPSDFLLAGVTYSLIRIAPIELQHRHKIYRWRGALQLGEPSVVLVGNFNRMYDPREAGHDIDDDTTWTVSDGNSAILWAWWRMHRFGRNRPHAEINWDQVEAAADLCDATKLNRSGASVPAYRCGIAAKESTPVHVVERNILATCDGYVAYDDQGRAYPVVGSYAAPTLDLTRARDIMTAATEVVDDGEQPVDGVVVYYTSPTHGYTKQPCAPWQNPEYYVDGREPNYRFVDVLGCQDHNQAFRLAGAIGARIAPPRKAALGCSLKGLLAKGERAINLTYDAQFTGVYEVASAIEESPNGDAVSMAVVPLGSDRWDGAGQSEGVPPAQEPALNIDISLEVAGNVVITAVPIQTDTGVAVRLEATFDAPDRIDRFYRFRYAKDGTTEYEYFTVDMDESRAYSAVLIDGQAYDVQWQTETAGGRASGWAADVGGGESVYEVTAVANATAPDDLVAAGASGGAGEATVTWTTANDANQHAVEIRRGATDVYGDAAVIATIVSGANVAGEADDTGLGAGTYYYWVTPINGSGQPGTADGEHSVSVT